MARISLHVSLLTLVVLVSIFTFIATFVPLYLSGVETGDEFSSMVRNEIGVRISTETRTFFSQYHPVLEGAVENTAYISNISNEMEILKIVCNAHKKVNMSTFFGSATGLFAKCNSFDGHETFHYQARHVTYANNYILDKDLRVTFSQMGVPLPKPYDPRIRSWYTELSVGSGGFSQLYLNFSTNATVITAGSPVWDTSLPTKTLSGVFAMDIFPINVVNYFSNVEVAKTGHAHLVEEKTLYLLGSDIDIPHLGYRLEHIQDEPNIPHDIRQVIQEVMHADRVTEERTILHFRKGRDRGYVERRRVPVLDMKLHVITVVEERDFLDSFYERTDIAIGLSVAVFAVIMIMAIVVASNITAPLRDLTVRIDDMALLDNLETDIDESIFTEVNSLQESFVKVVEQLIHVKKFLPQNVMNSEEDDQAMSSSHTIPIHMPGDGGDDSDDDWRNPNPKSTPDEDGTRRPSNTRNEHPNVPGSPGGGGGGSYASPLGVAEARHSVISPNDNASEATETESVRGGVKKVVSGSFKKQLKLNTTRLQDAANVFKIKRCSILIAELDVHSFTTKNSIEAAVSNFMNLMVKTALSHRGVIEVIRPDTMIISFSTVQHEQKAFNSALEIMELRPPSLVGKLNLVLDAGDCFKGNVGAQDRFAHVLFGPMIVTMRRMLQLVPAYRGSMLLLTSSIANAISEALPPDVSIFPIDVIKPWGGREGDERSFVIYDVAPDSFCGVELRTAFTLAQQGKLEECINLLRSIRQSNNPHVHRLLHVLENVPPQDRARLTRHYLFPWESFGGDVENIMTRVVGKSSKPEEQLVVVSDAVCDAYSSRFVPASDDGMPVATSFHHTVEVTSSEMKDAIRETAAGLRKSKNSVMIHDSAPPAADDGGGMMFAMFAPVPDLLAPDPEEAGGGAPEDEENELPQVFEDMNKITWHKSGLVLGKGSFGCVYQGMSDNGTLAALKSLKLKEDSNISDLEVEAHALAELSHENIVQLISIATTKKHIVFAMEYVPGGSAMTLMLSYEMRLPACVVKKFGRDTLHGLQYLHQMKVVHADIKPHNILIAGDGTAKISDFGSAVIGSPPGASKGNEGGPQQTASAAFAAENPSAFNGHSSSTVLRGTPHYAAPEVCDGRMPTAASDVWSFGVTLIHMATGVLPWQHIKKPGNFQFIGDVADGTICPMIPESAASELPSDLVDVVRQCWSTDPDMRPTADALLQHRYFL